MGMLNEAEWLTWKNRIDTRLCALTPPWKIIRYHDGLNLSSLRCVAVEEFPTANGPADYALFVNGVLLGIIEAKKVTVNPQNVLEQAKRYSAGALQGPREHSSGTSHPFSLSCPHRKHPARWRQPR